MSRKLASTLGGIMFIVACTTAALAMPTAFLEEQEGVLSGLDQLEPDDLEVSSTVPEGETIDVAVPTPTPTDDSEEESDGDGAENHGKAVSTAAHCAVKGRAHGELVRSIAQDKDATVAEAQAACDAALAAAALAPAKVKPAKPAHVVKPPKPQKAAKPVKAPKPAKAPASVVTETEDEAVTTVETPAPSHGGPPPGKGNPHKP